MPWPREITTELEPFYGKFQLGANGKLGFSFDADKVFALAKLRRQQ